MKSMPATTTCLLLASAAALNGCDKGAPPGAPKSPATATAKPGTATGGGDASAAEVARAARGALTCPARSSLPPRAATAPADDALGVRPGMTYEEAMAAVLCTNPMLVATPERARGFQIKTFGQTIRQGFNARYAEARVEKSGKQIVQEMQREATARSLNTLREDLQPGEQRWFVATMGVPGQERAISVGRVERYPAEQSPTVEAARDALVRKYGAPTDERRASPSQLPTLRWAHDPAGRPVTAGSPLFSRCVSHPDPDIGVHLTPECGLVVEALLQPQKTNPDLVDRLKLTIVDQGGGYRAIAATELALSQGDAQRRAREVQQSAKTGKTPSL